MLNQRSGHGIEYRSLAKIFEARIYNRRKWQDAEITNFYHVVMQTRRVAMSTFHQKCSIMPLNNEKIWKDADNAFDLDWWRDQ